MYLLILERELEQERERERDSQTVSTLSVEPNVRLDLMTMRSRLEQKPRADT